MMRVPSRAWRRAAVLLALTSTVSASSDSWQAMQERAVTLYGQRKFEESHKTAEQAVDSAERTFGRDHPRVGDSLEVLARATCRLGDHAKGETLYRRVLTIREKHGDSKAVAEILLRLAELYLVLGRANDARAAGERALALRRQLYGKTASPTVEAMIMLARIAMVQRRERDAVGIFQQALAILEAVLGDASPLVADTVIMLADAHAQTGNIEQARTLYQRAAELPLPAGGGAGRASAAPADLFAEAGRYDTAESMYQETLRLRQRALGAAHPIVGDSLATLSKVHALMGDVQTAQSLMERARSAGSPLASQEDQQLRTRAFERTDGEQLQEADLPVIAPSPSHSDEPSGQSNTVIVAKTMRSRASVYEQLGNFSEAETLYAQALDVYEKMPDVAPAEMEQTLRAYTDLLRRLGKAEQATAVQSRFQTLLAPQEPSDEPSTTAR